MEKVAVKTFKDAMLKLFSKSLKPKSVDGKWYDLEGSLGKGRVAVVLKTHKSAVRSNIVMKLLDEMDETNKNENTVFSHLISYLQAVFLRPSMIIWIITQSKIYFCTR